MVGGTGPGVGGGVREDYVKSNFRDWSGPGPGRTGPEGALGIHLCTLKFCNRTIVLGLARCNREPNMDID